MEDYQRYMEDSSRQWEWLCIRCGGCCGAYDDPCVHLKRENPGCWYCDIYANRLGERKTQAGETFNCVHVREIINTRWPNDHLCSYKKKMRKPWI